MFFCDNSEFIPYLFYFYSNVKGQPPPEAPGNAPERLHCFQQRKVSFNPEAAEEALALDKAFDSFGGPRAGEAERRGLWGSCFGGAWGSQGWGN